MHISSPLYYCFNVDLIDVRDKLLRYKKNYMTFVPQIKFAICLRCFFTGKKIRCPGCPCYTITHHNIFTLHWPDGPWFEPNLSILSALALTSATWQYLSPCASFGRHGSYTSKSSKSLSSNLTFVRAFNRKFNQLVEEPLDLFVLSEIFAS
ncbi:hypothetical protein CSKR_101979 [Clonorchis sinensis]|uniref:Uncharacterized protein n=1 Tax=Clonorchis sinensis TaxID=79923 RepID=A0A3R7F492_CLOSI|nr:hypothetical protein CSKR_101979 [Clonorchis sinensis]